jgi:hypothetical protein
MVLKGFELSDDDELPDEQDAGQSAYADNECPDIAMLEPVQPQVPAQPAEMPAFDFYQCIRRLGGIATTMFKALDDLVHMFQCWRNTKVTGDQVIFYRLYFAYSVHFAYTAYSCYDFILLLRSLVCKGSVAKLVGRQACCAGDEGSSSSGSECM